MTTSELPSIVEATDDDTDADRETLRLSREADLDYGWTEADEDAATLRLASARNPDLAFFPGDDHGYDRDYPDPRDY